MQQTLASPQNNPIAELSSFALKNRRLFQNFTHRLLVTVPVSCMSPHRTQYRQITRRERRPCHIISYAPPPTSFTTRRLPLAHKASRPIGRPTDTHAHTFQHTTRKGRSGDPSSRERAVAQAHSNRQMRLGLLPVLRHNTEAEERSRPATPVNNRWRLCGRIQVSQSRGVFKTWVKTSSSIKGVSVYDVN